MKKIFTLLIMMLSVIGFSQQKTTGVVNFVPGLTANLTLNNSNSTATLTINGPSDRWFAVTFGSFGNPGAMSVGNDVVYYNNVTLVDARHNGQGNTPIVDGVNNWSVTSNTVSSGTRTIVATRPFTAEATDYTFNYANASINLAASHAATPIYTLQYHENNRFNAGSITFSTLGVEDFSLNGSQIYPNPSKGEFVIKTKTYLEKITIYTHTGTYVKTIEVQDNAENVEVNINGLQTGIYLIELTNEKEKSWKKIIVN